MYEQRDFFREEFCIISVYTGIKLVWGKQTSKEYKSEISSTVPEFEPFLSFFVIFFCNSSEFCKRC